MKRVYLFLLILLMGGCGNNSDHSTPVGTLTEDQKYALAYMWHEEKLAKDLYLALNSIYPTRQLENIALNSETTHIQQVQNLIEVYDINITNLADYEIGYSVKELANMPAGSFAIPKIQSLYNTLLEIGSASRRASLEVGCMVEVVDINDLNDFLQTAQGNQYITDTFKSLMDGSYKHYWAFDSGLKSMGIMEGCCSIGSEYCHLEYPNSTGDQGARGR